MTIEGHRGRKMQDDVWLFVRYTFQASFSPTVQIFGVIFTDIEMCKVDVR